MLASYCTNPDCPEFGVAKGFEDPALAETRLMCGTCNRECPPARDVTVAAGEPVGDAVAELRPFVNLFAMPAEGDPVTEAWIAEHQLADTGRE